MIESGQKAPQFSLQNQQGKVVSLNSLAGRTAVLYFYPRDNTPGCTTEAIEFQRLLPEFEKAGAVVLGVSADSVESHCKFVAKAGLHFQLLADPSHEVAERYGVWVEKNMYGRKHWGIQRATFLIGRDGTVLRVWPKVKPAGHAEEVLEMIRTLTA